MNFAIVDIETTGGSPKDSKITEIAIYKHNGFEIIDEYETLINPEIPIPAFIANLTGINDQMVMNSPRFFEVAKDIVEFTKDCVFVAHNVAFDYGILRSEFRSLGFDYRLPHMCTVKTARKIIPGHDSYSLGKLTRSLGITLTGRHRAGGDALATAKLFTVLYAEDETTLKAMITEEVNPKRLHPNLDVNALDEIPNKAGVYKFFNEMNQLIYIGKSVHIKKRVEQHLRNSKSKKEIKLQKEIARIEFILTGSELIALILESKLIKQYKPIHNRALKRNKFPYGIFHYFDDNGYMRFFVGPSSKMSEEPIASFVTKLEGVAYLTKNVEKFRLCQKLSDLYNSNGACFHYSIKECNGACVKEESSEEYNKRCQLFINDSMLNNETFYIVDKGRERNEKSLIYVKNGSLKGFGYAPFHFNKQPSNKWDQFIQFTEEDRDARVILIQFLKKNNELNIVHLK
ncbi:MAG: exonuclease domain-containing protein [Crocinitomicaceae bacterium]|nr:exonuclease domain-containing protein [Crocinitomicaceae bacterium]